MMCFVGVSVGGEIDCLAEMHVSNADRVKSFEKVASVLTNAPPHLHLVIKFDLYPDKFPDNSDSILNLHLHQAF